MSHAQQRESAVQSSQYHATGPRGLDGWDGREPCPSGRNSKHIIGTSPAIQHVMRAVSLVAPTDASVLILGESGTGKELIAETIHQQSARRHETMSCVNCAAIPRELFESEFFGHVKGAFTGALKERVGRFEAADGGTLFLDEIAEIPLELQSKLLRVLQEGELERVGGESVRRVDVRIVAATNRDLASEVRVGRFREDLYYRLNVFPIVIPVLRERREDIPTLAAYFVRHFSRKLKRSEPALRARDIEWLQSQSWSGNVRELQNVIERALILSCGDDLALGDARGTFDDIRPPIHGSRANAILTEPERKQRERQDIIAALEQANGKIYGPRGAAEILGVKPTTLGSRIKTLGIQKSGLNQMLSSVG